MTSFFEAERSFSLLLKGLSLSCSFSYHGQGKNPTDIYIWEVTSDNNEIHAYKKNALYLPHTFSFHLKRIDKYLDTIYKCNLYAIVE